jgi:hypothetical protein
VSNFKERLCNACKLAQENHNSSQTNMKCWYDKDSRNRVFKPGDEVLVPIPVHPLQARYFGPNDIESKFNDVNYAVKTPGRWKETRVCHIKMLKNVMKPL